MRFPIVTDGTASINWNNITIYNNNINDNNLQHLRIWLDFPMIPHAALMLNQPLVNHGSTSKMFHHVLLCKVTVPVWPGTMMLMITNKDKTPAQRFWALVLHDE